MDSRGFLIRSCCGTGDSGIVRGPPQFGQRPTRPGVAPGAFTRSPHSHVKIGTLMNDPKRPTARLRRQPSFDASHQATTIVIGTDRGCKPLVDPSLDRRATVAEIPGN